MADFCPLIQKKCKEHKCKFYIQMIGMHPNTGENVNMYECAVNWIPTLLIENSKHQRESGAAIESFRNEMVRMNESSLNLLSTHTNSKALENE